MRRLFRLLYRLLLLLVLLAVLAVVFRNPVLRLVTEWQIQKETGLPAILGRIRVGLVSPVIRLENLRLMNPPEWGGDIFIDLPDLQIEYGRMGLMRRDIRLRRVTFELAELHIVEKEDGTTNAQAVEEFLRRRRLGARMEEAGFRFDEIQELTCSFERFSMTSYRSAARNGEVKVNARGIQGRDIRSPDDLRLLLGRAAREQGAVLAANYLLGTPYILLPRISPIQ